MITRSTLIASAMAIGAAGLAQRSPQKRSVAGDYEGIQVDGRMLPAYDRLPSVPGTVRAVSVRAFATTLMPNGRFRAMVRYTHETNPAGVRPAYRPVVDAAVAGRYTVSGATITFVPDRKPNEHAARREVFTGTLAGARLTVPFDYVNGSTRRHVVIVLDKVRDW